MQDYCNYFRECLTQNPKPEFIEGIVFSKNQAVIHTGEMVDEIDTLNSSFFTINNKSPWYFKHVESMLKNKNKTIVEYMHTR